MKKDKSLAIAYEIQKANKKKKKMANGGSVEAEAIKKQEKAKFIQDSVSGGGPMSESEYKMLEAAYEKKKKMADGGEVKKDNVADARGISTGQGIKGETMNDKARNIFGSAFQKKAHGGEVEEHYASIADAILAKKRRMEGADDMANLSLNAVEEPNNEDQLSWNALRKENYSESEGLEQLDQPEDSNLHDVEIESDKHDKVGAIRKRMKKRM